VLKIELVCDANLLGCYSRGGLTAVGPSATARHSPWPTDLIARAETLEDTAGTRGWIIVEGECFCPACKIMRPGRR
jgi:hypothetical protein